MQPRRFAAFVFAMLALAGCSPGQVVRAVAGAAGGRGVNANLQAGKTNSQTIGATSITEQKLVRPRARNIEQSTGETGVRAEAVQSVTVNNEAPPWVWLMAVGLAAAAAWALTDEIRDRIAKRKGKRDGSDRTD